MMGLKFIHGPGIRMEFVCHLWTTNCCGHKLWISRESQCDIQNTEHSMNAVEMHQIYYRYHWYPCLLCSSVQKTGNQIIDTQLWIKIMHIAKRYGALLLASTWGILEDIRLFRCRDGMAGGSRSNCYVSGAQRRHCLPGRLFPKSRTGRWRRIGPYSELNYSFSCFIKRPDYVQVHFGTIAIIVFLVATVHRSSVNISFRFVLGFTGFPTLTVHRTRVTRFIFIACP